MAGALNSVFGGGGPLGAIMSVVSVVFPPAAIATSVANLVTQGIGAAVNMAAQQLCQTAGMPKFLADMIGGLVNKVVGQLTQHSNPGADQAARERFGGDIHQMVQSLVKAMVEGTKALLEQSGEGKPAKGGGKSTTSSANWLVALAQAMGKAAGDHAKKMVELSHKINELSDARAEIDSKDEKALGDNAAATTATQAELQGEGQLFGMLQNAFASTIKSIGEGLTTMARKG